MGGRIEIGSLLFGVHAGPDELGKSEFDMETGKKEKTRARHGARGDLRGTP